MGLFGTHAATAQEGEGDEEGNELHATVRQVLVMLNEAENAFGQSR